MKNTHQNSIVIKQGPNFWIFTYNLRQIDLIQERDIFSPSGIDLEVQNKFVYSFSRYIY